MLANSNREFNYVTDLESPTSVKAMRQAAHNILYVVANSRACAEENNVGMQGWQKILLGVDIALAVLLIALEVVLLRKYKRRKG